jgi:hypothetical protein
MNEDQIRAAVVAERGEQADLLDALAPEQWNAPTLCAGWRVREVVAGRGRRAGPSARALRAPPAGGKSPRRGRRSVPGGHLTRSPAPAEAAHLTDGAGLTVRGKAE